MTNLVPRTPLDILPRLSDFFDGSDWPGFQTSSVFVREDAERVFVEAPLPGVDPKHIDVTFDNGLLWIRANESAEDAKGRRVARFSYRVTVPGAVDESAEPEARIDNGMLTVVFKKSPEKQPKKITVKKG